MNNSWYRDYDELIGKVCPNYDVSLTRLVESVSEGAKRIVELGTGTGNLTERLASRFPDTQIVGYDDDHSMLGRAKEKLRQYGNVELVEQFAQYADFQNANIV